MLSVVGTPWRIRLWKPTHFFWPKEHPEIKAFERKYGDPADPRWVLPDLSLRPDSPSYLNQWIYRYVVDRESALRFSQLTGAKFIDREAWAPFKENFAVAVAESRYENEIFYLEHLLQWLAKKGRAVAWTSRPPDYPTPAEVDPERAFSEAAEIIDPKTAKFLKERLRLRDERYPKIGEAVRKMYNVDPNDLPTGIEFYFSPKLKIFGLAMEKLANKLKGIVNVKVGWLHVNGDMVIVSPYYFTTREDIFNPDFRISRVDFAISLLREVGFLYVDATPKPEDSQLPPPKF